ncbi:MAG: transglutaminase family protein [Pirellulaceae bacterium]|nr:transglutaminase family protein [Pirellulaceae bacterium]
MIRPTFCSPIAFDFFADQLARLDTTEGLIDAATAISMHSFDDVRPVRVRAVLRHYARLVCRRVRSEHPRARLAHLHAVLFDEAGFHGNSRDYYSPLNCFLPAVLESRQGLPVTLALVYKGVAERVGLRVEGLNAPRHFLVRVHAGCDSMIVDPYHGGQVLSASEALRRCGVGHPGSGPSLGSANSLPVADNRRWLSRMLANLRAELAVHDRQIDLAAMCELQELLDRQRI